MTLWKQKKRTLPTLFDTNQSRYLQLYTAVSLLLSAIGTHSSFLAVKPEQCSVKLRVRFNTPCGTSN